jgi:hypothetical protein
MVAIDDGVIRNRGVNEILRRPSQGEKEGENEPFYKYLTRACL